MVYLLKKIALIKDSVSSHHSTISNCSYSRGRLPPPCKVCVSRYILNNIDKNLFQLCTYIVQAAYENNSKIRLDCSQDSILNWGGLFGLLKILDCIRACGGSILYENFFFAQRIGND